MKKTLAAVAILGAFAGSAMADVTVYGIVDLGLGYTNVDGVDTVEMKSGMDSANPKKEKKKNSLLFPEKSSAILSAQKNGLPLTAP